MSDDDGHRSFGGVMREAKHTYTVFRRFDKRGVVGFAFDDRLVKNRERSIKGSRYKIGNAKAGYHYNPHNRIHSGKVEFRWGTVRTLVNEILEGLGDE